MHGISQVYLWYILGISQVYPRHIYLSQVYLKYITGIYQAYPRNILVSGRVANSLGTRIHALSQIVKFRGGIIIKKQENFGLFPK